MPIERDDADKANIYEELRFAKNQQWAGATAAITLLAGIYAAEKGSLGEKIATALSIVLIASAGGWFLIKLQMYIYRTRLDLNPADSGATLRGVDVLAVLIGAIVLSAVFVFYILILRCPQ
jgi:hypothetical protein